MSNDAALHDRYNPREHSRALTESSLHERVRALAADGLKLRDISSLLGIHPEIVRRILEAA